MIRRLSSLVWGGVPKGVYQDYGPTTVPGEPYSYRDKSPFHCGIDIGDLGIGWPLRAARAGLVVSVGWGQLGILVGSETDWYIHIDRSVVSVGQQVSRRQLVAYSGGKVPAGGTIYGAHLHFEVQTARPPTYNRPLTSVDPEAVLTGLYGGGGGELDVNTEQDQTIHATQTIVARIEALLTAVNAETLVRIETEIQSLKRQIADLPAGSAPGVDLKPLFEAIAAIKVPTAATIPGPITVKLE